MATNLGSKRQLAWVFDLNKCIGCQTCSVACKVLWNDKEEGADHQWSTRRKAPTTSGG
jgi:nitrate reductase beta subunit